MKAVQNWTTEFGKWEIISVTVKCNFGKMIGMLWANCVPLTFSCWKPAPNLIVFEGGVFGSYLRLKAVTRVGASWWDQGSYKRTQEGTHSVSLCHMTSKGGCLQARERALTRKLMSQHLHVRLPKKIVTRSGKVCKDGKWEHIHVCWWEPSTREERLMMLEGTMQETREGTGGSSAYDSKPKPKPKT